MNQYGQLLIYKDNEGNNQIEVKLFDNSIWLTQDQIVNLYQSSKSNISEHIKHILEEGELDENSVVRKYRTTASDGKMYNKKHYNLDMIIAIGYRVKSNIGVNFRKWATETLKEYMTKGFALNDDLLKRAGGGLYFKELLARIRDIRSSEKVFWRQVLDIYATSIDYDPQSKISQEFFKTVQNKMHWAAHGHTAAEIIMLRADSNKENMGMTNYIGDYPTLQEATIAKNYLTENELNILNRIVTLYLDFAELQALEENPMTMSDWVEQLDYFLKMSRKDILKDKGTVSHAQALQKARIEYEKYKEIQENSLSNVEKHFLENIKQLDEVSDK
ncbi:MAG: virulence RhuM family protein [Erysipelotrichaceae bacterium]|nr:virulence RhuM family protein [Erysipelotrichaceae bacterium]MBR6516433.1 virulence RhuM family protein [Bacilli bacterium]